MLATQTIKNKTAIVIGAGFSGLSAATNLAAKGWQVQILEKHNQAGGRARRFEKDGFVFDMGPSWYWMPDVFERYFGLFGKKVSDYYKLIRLDPSYRIFFEDGPIDIPATPAAVAQLFETLEVGAAQKLEAFLKEAAYKYQVGIHKLVHKPGQSITEFLDLDVAKGVLKLDIFTNMQKHVSRYFKHEKIRKIMEFPVLFLGALAADTPALYSLMNYADIDGGTWYPEHGMYSIVQAMEALAKEKGVNFKFNCAVAKANIVDNKIQSVEDASGNTYTADIIINSADYNFFEQNILPASHRQYSADYWQKRKMAPSCLLYYVGVNKKLENLPHHTLFFDTNFDTHGDEIYKTEQWPSAPLFYMSVVSKTDAGSAPADSENIFLLIPIAAGLEGDNEMLRTKYFNMLCDRIEQLTGNKISDCITSYTSYSVENFKEDYGAFKGNAYGLANTLLQTAILKPSLRSKKISNLFYTGQLTVPGPGVPPSLISGEVVANFVEKNYIP
ncbi:MAG: phytoene desaturase [Bacteroidota bacterium]|jgi:phytoene desaturase